MAVAIPVPDKHQLKRFTCPVCNSVDVELRHLPIDLFRELNDHQHVHSFFQYETLNIEYTCVHIVAHPIVTVYTHSIFARRSPTPQSL